MMTGKFVYVVALAAVSGLLWIGCRADATGAPAAGAAQVAEAAVSAAEDGQTKATSIEVRVISRGGKFVGTSMGGVRITIRDVVTGELLAQGVTAGSTGDTEKIMTAQPRQGEAMSTDDSAVFRTVLRLAEPRLVEVSAYGPLAQRQSANKVSQTQFVVPGKDINQGDSWLLELPGLVVDVLEPAAHVKLSGGPQTVRLHANVAMMCGCPIEPGGTWDAGQFEVGALLKRDGEPVGEAELEYAGEPSQFAAEIEVDEPGTYEATVYAYDPTNGNTGLDSTTYIVLPAEDE